MTKQELAAQLRGRQVARGMVPIWLLWRITDEEIIESYITCAHCGERWVAEEELDELIRDSKDAEDFMIRMGGFRGGH